MNERRRSYRVLVRYTLIQLPGTALLILVLIMLHWWVNIPIWLILTIIMLSVAKDIIMFPVVRRAYDKDNTGNVNSIVGSRGTAVDSLCPAGYIRVRGELWQAEVIKGNQPINKGEIVQVIGSRGLTLLVESENDPMIADS